MISVPQRPKTDYNFLFIKLLNYSLFVNKGITC